VSARLDLVLALSRYAWDVSISGSLHEVLMNEFGISSTGALGNSPFRAGQGPVRYGVTSLQVNATVDVMFSQSTRHDAIVYLC